MSCRYNVISQEDLKNVYIVESTDDNKIVFDTNSYYVEFSLTDLELADWKLQVTSLMRYVNQDGWTQKNPTAKTTISNNVFNETETESYTMDETDGVIYMTFSCTKATQDYRYKIYLTKSILDSIDSEVTKMIEKTYNETLISSGTAGNDGSNNFVLFTTTSSQNLKIYIQSGLLSGFQTALDSENTLIQATTGDPAEYTVEQSASSITSKNTYSEVFQQDSVNTIIVQRDAGNNSAVVFTGNDVDGYEVVIKVLLSRDTLDAFNTQVALLS